MEKLIELLNEYEKENWRNFEVKEIWMKYRNNDLMVISKRYLFIKWLVKNDKIDRHSKELELDMKRIRIPQDYYLSWGQSLDLQHKKAQYLSLIALLSIQDNPIKFLCSVLK